MTASADQDGDDPGNGDGNYASAAEVDAALRELLGLPGELNRIEERVRILWGGSTMEPGDLVNEAVKRLLGTEGERCRHWHRSETITACLYRTIKSIARDNWRRQMLPILSANEAAAGHRDEADPERQSMAREALLEVLRFLRDESPGENTSAIALAIASGRMPAEIRKQFGITETEYDTELKRIQRIRSRLLKRKWHGGQA